MDKGWQKHMVPFNAVPSRVEHRQEETILFEQGAVGRVQGTQ